MTKKLTVGSESFDYPVTSDNNYGEPATNWASEINDTVAEFFGPGDIKTTESVILDGTTANVAGLLFDTTFVQRIEITGIITRKFNSSPTKVEAFLVVGSYNGVGDFDITVEFSGDDSEVTLAVTGGQFTYTAATVADTSEMSIKFKAQTIIDKDAI